jgi:hypothetical protein
VVSRGIKVARRVGCRRAPPTRPGLVAGRAPGQSTALVVVVVSCQRQRRCTRYGSTSIQEQGGPKTRTVPYGAGSTGSDWARHWGAGEHRAHVSGTDTTPPRPGAQLARSAAGRIKRVQLGRGKDVIRQATWSRQGCNPAGDLNRRTARSWYVRGAVIPKGTTTLPRAVRGEGYLLKAQIEYIGRRRSRASGGRSRSSCRVARRRRCQSRA